MTIQHTTDSNTADDQTDLSVFGVDEHDTEPESASDPQSGSEPADSADDEPFDAEERGRIARHTRKANTVIVLRILGVSGPSRVRTFQQAIETLPELVAWYDDHGEFTAIEGVGPATTDQIEAAIPVIRTALAERSHQSEADR